MAGFEFLLAGRTLADRYRLEAVIGRGGMGAVFRAADLRLDRPVAVKVVATHEDDGRMRARFRREAQSAARIRHPHVVTVFDFGTDPELGLDFLVMELLEGEDLSRRVARQGALPLGAGLAVLRDVAEGLAAGHRLGLVHRDVKPGNVFLVGPGERAVLLDFGIAKAHAEEDDTHTALTRVGGAAPHSPGFAAPEQLRGDAQLTPACDIFSLAATAYYALSGERVFTPQQIQALAAGEAVPAVPLGERVDGIPPEMDRAISQSLHPDPAARPGDADSFLAMLGGAEHPPAPRPATRAPTSVPGAAAEPGPATLETAPAALPAPRRSPWLWPLIGVAAIGTAVLLAFPVTGPAPVAVAPPAADTTAAVDSAALAAARADSAERAQVRRDSIRRAREDSIRLATAAAESVRAETTVVTPPPVEPPPAGSDAYDLSALDRQPVLSNRGEMRRVSQRLYPRQLREAGVEGRVEVAFVIGPNGRPEPGSIRVLSADNPAFSDAALRIAEHLRFRPGEVAGRRVRVATSMPINFQVGN